MEQSLRIRPAVQADAEAIAGIYNHYVLNDTCTYREEAEPVEERRAWLAAHTGGHVALVAEDADGSVAGWASLSRFHERSAFRFTVEDSVYLRHDCRSRGLGTRLLRELMDHARRSGFHAIVAVISAEQDASIALHRRCGFAEAGRLHKVSCKFGRWLDVVYMQRTLQA
jgi:L-amino acid N-acyltransferase